MAPRDGDTKSEDGLDWVYRDPPGTWVVPAVTGPLGWRFPDDDLKQTYLDSDDNEDRGRLDEDQGQAP